MPLVKMILDVTIDSVAGTLTTALPLDALQRASVVELLLMERGIDANVLDVRIVGANSAESYRSFLKEHL